MNKLSIKLVIIVVIIMLVLSCSKDSPIAPIDQIESSSHTNLVAKTGEDRTPFQSSIEKTFAQRKAEGIPIPFQVIFEYRTDSKIAKQTTQHQSLKSGEDFTIIATTIIHFENPEQAGNERWPDVVVEGAVPPDANGFIKEGNYTQFIKEKLEEEDSDIWNKYEYGHEPRVYTIKEKIDITYPNFNDSDPGLNKMSEINTTTINELLMGRYVPGPELDYTIEWDFEVLGIKAIDFKAGFALDWGLGIRLPMEDDMTITDPMYEGSTYNPTTIAKGLDWLADDFENAGVEPEDGNEFVMRFEFFCGVKLEVAGIDVMDLNVDVDIDESSSFETPFGPGSYFDLPTLDIKIWDLDVGVAYGKISFQLTPEVGSDKFTAKWIASGEATGSGSVTYVNPTIPVAMGPVKAIDGPGSADITMESFKYYFNKFLLDLNLSFYLDVFGVWDGSFDVPITDFDLSALTGHLYVDVHSGTPDKIKAFIPIKNVTPTAVIDRSGTLLINGTATFFSHPGEPLIFTGRATDPGLDDLTLSWDWNDGLPSPDITTHYTVPYDISESKSHDFDGFGLFWVGFKAVDDDLANSEDMVPVIITETGNRFRSEGYWQHQLSGVGKTDFDAMALENALEIVSHMSVVFNEERDASTIANAYDVIFLQHNYGSIIEQLDRELLVVWINFVNGVCDYMDLIDTDGDNIGDTTFGDVVTAAEAVRLNTSATNAELLEQIEILHTIRSMIV